MNNNDIEEDIEKLERVIKLAKQTGLDKTLANAIENILADRENYKVLYERTLIDLFEAEEKANKYDKLVGQLKRALDFVKIGKDADSKAKAKCLENILELIKEE